MTLNLSNAKEHLLWPCDTVLSVISSIYLLVNWFLNPRIPVQVKRPNTGAKAQRKECPVRGAAGKGQPSSKSDRPAGRDPRNPRVNEEKVIKKKSYLTAISSQNGQM